MSKPLKKIRLFDGQTARKPDRYPWTRAFIKAMNDGFWTVDRFDFKTDKQDFALNLTEQERVMVVRTASAIGQIEIAVKEYWSKIGFILPHPSIKDVGFTLSESEVRHNYAYEKILEVLDMEHIFEDNMKLPIIANRVKYLTKHAQKAFEDDKKQFIYSLILFSTFVENVSLFSQFYVISWMKRNRNVLKEFANQVRYTRNEELCHFLFGARLIKELREEYPDLFDSDLKKVIEHEAKEAVIAELKIIKWMLNGYNAPGLNEACLGEYIKNRINTSLVELGFEPVFEVDEALLVETVWSDEETIGNTLTDFFAGTPVEYKEAGLTISTDELFIHDEEFTYETK